MRSPRGIVRVSVEVKSWLAALPSVSAVRPAKCPRCGVASRPVGGGLSLHGHGKRSRQLWGPRAPGSAPELVLLEIRRYRCTRCRAVIVVAPSEVLTKRLYSAPAIAWALALFGLVMMAPAKIRELLSPWKNVGATSAARWLTLLRWTAAVADGRLFPCVASRCRSDPSARQVASLAALYVGTYAIPTPEPPPPAVLAFLGATRAP